MCATVAAAAVSLVVVTKVIGEMSAVLLCKTIFIQTPSFSLDIFRAASALYICVYVCIRLVFKS